LSKTKQSISKSVKENATKIRSNLNQNISSLKKYNVGGRNGNAPDIKLTLPELREQMRQSNRAMKRAVMEKCYQDFHKKLYVPCLLSTETENALLKDDRKEIEEATNVESLISTHTDIVVEFSSIFDGEYGTALETWMGAFPTKNPRLVREILFETIMTCYYHMICEKANILKKYNRVNLDQKRYLTFMEFERHYSEQSHEENNASEASQLCHTVVDDIYQDTSSLYFEYTSFFKQPNDVENVTRLLIAKCCEVIWGILCSENNEKTLLLYPIHFQQTMKNKEQQHSNEDKEVLQDIPEENDVEWFEVQVEETDTKIETETSPPGQSQIQSENPSQAQIPSEPEDKPKSNHTAMHVCFPGVVQIHKNVTQQQSTLLCKAKVFYS